MDDHWSPQRKTALLLAIDYRLIAPDEAGARFSLSAEELDSWRREQRAHGLGGLRVTRLQCYHPERRRR